MKLFYKTIDNLAKERYWLRYSDDLQGMCNIAPVECRTISDKMWR